MGRGRILTIVRVASIVAVVAAIVVQAVELANHGAFDATRFFAYFTIQSNLVGVAAFGGVLANRAPARSRALESFRGARDELPDCRVLRRDRAALERRRRTAARLGRLRAPQAVPGRSSCIDWLVDPPTVRLTARDALALARLSAGLDRADAPPRRSGRLVSLPVPEPGERRLRDSRRDRSSRSRSDSWRSPRSGSGSATSAAARGRSRRSTSGFVIQTQASGAAVGQDESSSPVRRTRTLRTAAAPAASRRASASGGRRTFAAASQASKSAGPAAARPVRPGAHRPNVGPGLRGRLNSRSSPTSVDHVVHRPAARRQARRRMLETLIGRVRDRARRPTDRR